MTLLERLHRDLKEAAKLRDKESSNTIRLLLSAIQLKEKDGKTQLIDDTVVLSVIEKELKQTYESLEFVKKAGKENDISKLTCRISYLEKFLPEQMSDVEVENLVRKIISDHHFNSKKDKRQLMPILMPLVKGKADGKLVNHYVDQLLS